MATDLKQNFKCQDAVIVEDKEHGLFLTVHLNHENFTRDWIIALKKIQDKIDTISPKGPQNKDSQLSTAFSFGPEFLKKIYPEASQNGVVDFSYRERISKSSRMPSTGGDILLHAKCNRQGILFQVAEAVLTGLPKNAIRNVEEVYGFSYRDGRDISDFIDNTNNPSKIEDRIKFAVDSKTGGSYVLTQRWVHDMKTARNSPKSIQEHWFGRTKEDSKVLNPLPSTSHIALVRPLTKEAASNAQLVRHSMPYGIFSGECGNFFIACVKTPKVFDEILDRMMKINGEGPMDELFKFSRPVTGRYFYCPSREEMKQIFGAV